MSAQTQIWFSSYLKNRQQSVTKIIFFKAKTFLFVFFYSEEKKKRKQFRFISKKGIIIFNYLLIFEAEVYYALYCPLKSYFALELSI